jgi:hypothetical protein
MLKIRFEYDLPVYDSAKHDPDKVFRLLTYRGITYAKMVYLKSRGTSNTFSLREVSLPLFFCGNTSNNCNIYYNSPI